MADTQGETATALAAYAAALAVEPQNAALALRTLRTAVAAGDKPLAVAAAAQLATTDALPPDGYLLLFGDRLEARDVAGARAILATMEKGERLAFFLPVLRSWLGLAARDPSAPDIITGASASSLGPAITTEQRTLTGLLAGRRVEAISLVRSAPGQDARAAIMRLTAAATLQKMGDRSSALALLDGTDSSFALARARLAANRPIGGAIDTPVKGLAFFYARLAIDMVREKSDFFAMTMARYAHFLDPNSPLVALAEAQALAANGLDKDALQAIDRIDPTDPYAATALESRLALYERLGRAADAASLAQAVAQDSPRAADHLRLGNILTRQARHKDAAAAFAQAIEAPDKSGALQLSALWMLKGGALAQAGDWPAAESALRTALSLGPDEAAILNYLGYSLLERRQSIAEATTLIARAAELQPYNTAIKDSLGWAYFLSGDYSRAVETLEKAIIAEPNDPTINEHLGDAYWRAGQKVAARYAWRSAQLTADDTAKKRLSEKSDIGLTDDNVAR